MKTKFILAAIAGAIVQFLLGWLVYGILLAGFMATNTVQYEGLMKDMSDSFMVIVFIAGLTMATLITFIFQQWAKFDTFLKGLSGGMVIGFFFALSYDLFSYSMMNLMSFQALVVDVIVNTIITGIVGAVIAWILGIGVKGQDVK